MLRWIGLLTMLIDHIAIYFVDHLSPFTYELMRSVGRLAMPIFSYYLVIGVQRSRNLYLYFIRLVSCAAVAQFSVWHCHQLIGKDYSTQPFNFVFNLALGIISLTGLELVLKSFPDILMRAQPVEGTDSNPQNLPINYRTNVLGLRLKPGLGILTGIFLISLVLSCCIFFDISYGIYGQALLFIFYFAERRKSPREKIRFAFFAFALSSLAYSALSHFFPELFTRYSNIQAYALLAIPLIYLLPERPRKKPKICAKQLKRLAFYLFYPLHFYFIIFLRLYIFRLGKFFTYY
ncbi:MAG: TraX family protein [Eubacteriales bacterium]|nr:TraX family protein [Eubacteriales bacterium]